MLNIKTLREDADHIKARLFEKGKDYSGDVDKALELDDLRKTIIGRVEADKARQNAVSKQIPVLKKQGQDASALLAEMKALSDEIKQQDAKLAETEAELRDLMLRIPNVPDDSVPNGLDSDSNVELRRWGEPKKFDFEPKPHWDIGADLDILDLPRAAKVAGARFYFLKGAGALLERAILNFCLTSNIKAGYTELITPYMANSATLTGTGQLPKFRDDMFHVEGTDYCLISTAEIPVTNYHANEILEQPLPLKYTAFSPCFRSEAGAAGRDTRGIIRVHQFHKVEIVKFAYPEQSMQELEDLVAQPESILRALGLPYRVVFCCTGDMGSNQVKQYDIEVWMPSYGKYVEISSCSNYGDYQARRANIRFRREKGGKPEIAHTLNGSSLPGARTVAAIMENYQNADGSITVPEALRPYMGMDVIK